MALHPHGHINRYRNSRCRCDRCRAANTRAVNRYRAAVESGRHRPMVDAEPIRQHVMRLRAGGLGIERIAELAGVRTKVVGRLVYGTPSQGLAPTSKMMPGNADKLLAVHPGRMPDGGWAPGEGTRRRLQALAAVGWPMKHVELLARLPKSYSFRIIKAQPGFRVTVATARAVTSVYSDLWDVNPHTAGIRPDVVTRVRNRAAAKGWLPPQAWDDDCIDLPDWALETFLQQQVELMEDDDLRRCATSRRIGDRSPLTVAGSREYDRRQARKRTAA